MLFRFLIPALIAASPAALAGQALTPAETTQVDTLVGKALSDTGVPSASVAIVRGGRVVFTKAYGKQSERARAANSRAPYQIASISKQFTAAALLLLQRDGKLSLDDTVSKYVPGVTGGDTITLRQLVSHTAGLQDYWPQDYSFRAMETPTTPQGIVDRWGKKPLDFTPGTKWQYSNTGYVVAGMAVEKVTGEPLLAFLQRRIFAPLGMTAIDQDEAIGPNYPQGYHRFALGPVRLAPPAARGWLFAAGELSMSAADLARWDIARIDRTVLRPDDWQAQETAVKLADGKDTGYGLGVSVGTWTDGRRYVEHSGEAVGFLSENIVFPDDRAAVIVFVNADFSDTVETIAKGVVAAVLPPTPGADPGTSNEAARTTQARHIYDMLRTGTLDPATMTANANYYFNPAARADYAASLGALGEPTAFEPVREPRLRGGFVNRNYTVTYPHRKLRVITYAEPGDSGRYEQFLVQPAQ